MINKNEYFKNYHIINKNEIKIKKKIYRKVNKNYILNYKKIKVVCACGCNIRKSELYKHIKTKKHTKLLNKIADHFLI